MKKLWRTVKSIPRWAWYILAAVLSFLALALGTRSFARRLLPSRRNSGPGPDIVEALSPAEAKEKREEIREVCTQATDKIDESHDAELAELDDWLESDTDPDSGGGQ